MSFTHTVLSNIALLDYESRGDVSDKFVSNWLEQGVDR